MTITPTGTEPSMSAKKHAWTEPGPIIDPDTHVAAESRKGTAAANPVLSLAPRPQPPIRTRAAGGGQNGHNGHERAPDNRSPAQIEADIELTRDRLAGTLDELSERLTPRALMRRANTKARGLFVAQDGGVRKDRAAIAAGSVISVVGGCVALRRLRHH
jgi:hypothetical protein